MSISGVTPIEALANQLLSLLYNANADDDIHTLLQEQDHQQIALLYTHADSHFIKQFIVICFQRSLSKSFHWLIEHHKNRFSISDITDKRNNTLLHLVAMTQPHHAAIAESLLKNCTLSDLKKLNADGLSFLHLAVQYKKIDLLGKTDQYFTERQLYIDTRSANNETPLHFAVRDRYTTMVTLLIRMGSNLYARNNDNRTPLQLAESDAELLESMMENKTPSHHTVELLTQIQERSLNQTKIEALQKEFKHLSLSGDSSSCVASSSSNDSSVTASIRTKEDMIKIRALKSIIKTHLAFNLEDVFLESSQPHCSSSSSSEVSMAELPLSSRRINTEAPNSSSEPSTSILPPSSVNLDRFFKKSLLPLTLNKEKDHYINALKKLATYLEQISITHLLDKDGTIDAYITSISNSKITLSIIHQVFVDIKNALSIKLNIARKKAFTTLNEEHTALTTLIYALYKITPKEQLDDPIEEMMSDTISPGSPRESVFNMIGIIENELHHAPSIIQGLAYKIGGYSHVLDHVVSLFPYLNPYQRNIANLIICEVLYLSFDSKKLRSPIEHPLLERFITENEQSISTNNFERQRIIAQINGCIRRMHAIQVATHPVLQNNLDILNQWFNIHPLYLFTVDFEELFKTTLDCEGEEYGYFVRSLAHELSTLSLGLIQSIKALKLGKAEFASFHYEVLCWENLSNLVKISLLSCRATFEFEKNFKLWVNLANELLKQPDHIGPDFRSISAIVSGLESPPVSRLIETMPHLEWNVTFRELKALFTVTSSSKLNMTEASYPCPLPRIFTLSKQLTLANENQTFENKLTTIGNILLSHMILQRNLALHSVTSFSNLKTTLERQYPTDAALEIMSYKLLGPIIHLHSSRTDELLQKLQQCIENKVIPRFKCGNTAIALESAARELSTFISSETAKGKLQIDSTDHTVASFLDYLDEITLPPAKPLLYSPGSAGSKPKITRYKSLKSTPSRKRAFSR
ncbi:RasGEF domain-containing protein [Candidatus Berkiella aquae]|uniref:Ankyrin repeats (3 copies) n=1 Tax=Candidatus Berkiella aquae TaxID=295108 RepID=A0A0Q9YVE5_9GAMM|nr:RasGEF domain-containing protein [Candidatus Berkiella aquae]MCS5710224.1 hypothetical protein [Candidatus Berkiella aquae]